MPKLNEIPEPLRRRLYLPAYSVGEAARYAHIHPSTVAYWHYHEGKYGPVLPGKERRKPLNYFQLTEIGVVATFRRLGVTLRKIKRARADVAQTMESEYPFVEYGFRREGQNMLLDLQQVEPDPEIGALIIATADGQMTWNPEVEKRFLEFDYEYDVVMRWHVAGRESPVLIDPKISFGAPAVHGVPTWALRARAEAGELPAEMADDFGLETQDVVWALRFEGIKVAA